MKPVTFNVPEVKDVKEGLKNAPETARKIAGFTMKAIGLGLGMASVQAVKASQWLLKVKQPVTPGDGPKE